MPNKLINLSGQRFGKLVVSKLFQKSTRETGTVWECFCDCGNITKVRSSELRRKSLNSDRKGTISCGCARILPNDEANLTRIYAQYRKDARYANRIFDLTKEFFREITEKDCYYCGTPPYKSEWRKNRPAKPYIHNGIDRIDSKIGYIKSNCRPCCTHCNFAKNSMTEKEFKDHIEKIYKHWVTIK